MSKYYKEEDLTKALTGFIRETGIDETPYEYAEFALDKIPSIEVDEDCISKGKLITDLQGIWDAYTPNNMIDFQDMLEDIYYKIKDAPSVTPTEKTTETMIVDGMETEIDPVSYEVGYSHRQVAPTERTGKWIVERYCSECEWDKKDAELVCNIPTNYCPNCGADMRGNNNESG